MGGATYVSDGRGNLTSDAARTYTYDLDNRLTGVSGAQAGTLLYDPLGRVRRVTSGGSTTDWLWDGDRLVAEYNDGTGTYERYAHGPGPDEPLVSWFKSTSAGRQWFHTDHQNTVVAVTDGTGAIVGSPYTYDAYGQPAGGAYTGPRFRFTGQTSLPGAPPLWHYKARAYAPGIGRFLQTDPIGYAESLNLYSYVGNDPFNGVDPTGKCPLTRCPDVVVEVNGNELVRVPGYAVGNLLRQLIPGGLAGAAIVESVTNSNSQADTDAEADDLADSQEYDQCVRECIQQYLDDPRNLPGEDFRDYAPRLQRCIHECRDRAREERLRQRDQQREREREREQERQRQREAEERRRNSQRN